MCTSLSESVFVGTFLWDLCHCTSLCKLCTEEGWFADVHEVLNTAENGSEEEKIGSLEV